MSPPPKPHGDLYDFEGDRGIWHGPLGPADPVNINSTRLMGGAIGLGVSIMGVAIWSSMPTLCRLAVSMRDALL